MLSLADNVPFRLLLKSLNCVGFISLFARKDIISLVLTFS